jgi:type VI secretion system secreted protein VgrG
MTHRFNAPSLLSLNALLIAALIASTGTRAEAAPLPPVIDLGQAESFAVLGGSTITNVGFTVVTGDLGLSPGTVVSGFGPGVVTGATHINDQAAADAQTDASLTYAQLAGLAFMQDLSTTDLGERTLTAGVYHYSSSAVMNGTLVLDGGNQSDALFVFQIGTTLTTTNASFDFINGASADNVWFQVGSSATLNAGTLFSGTLLASESITLGTGVAVEGRILALNGAVTLAGNEITNFSSIPEPATNALIAAGIALFGVIGIRARRR